MEENQKIEETRTVINGNYRDLCDRPSLWKSVLCGLLVFIGAYCAFYTMADWHYKRMISRIFNPTPRQMERMVKQDINHMDKMFRPERGFMQRGGANIIHMEQNGSEYKVMIDLRAFDNNEKNVQVAANGNILTISGRSIRKSKNNEQISEFQHNYMFGDNVKLADLTKETNGNYYIVTIPIEDKIED